MLKLDMPVVEGRWSVPAAFGRLCVETAIGPMAHQGRSPAAFGRLCVETFKYRVKNKSKNQPPSGGCVLKLRVDGVDVLAQMPAAFGRLCVETLNTPCSNPHRPQPPSGGCVGQHRYAQTDCLHCVPAAFGRLCVETLDDVATLIKAKPSRLRAAVC